MRSMAVLGVSAAAREIGADVALAAGSGARVLITGERGVGKTTIAWLIHAAGPRKDAAFVRVRCTSTADGLLPAQQPRGALHAAQGGTLLLADVEAAGPGTQAHLLQLIREGAPRRGGTASTATGDVRLVTSSSASLVDLVHARQFRADLFYQLNVVHIVVPPLRERREDIHGLLSRCLAESAADARRARPELTIEAWARLYAYHWPGNLREMRGLAGRLVRHARDGRIGPDELVSAMRAPASALQGQAV